MERLWAPWRMQYINTPETRGCIFCDKPRLGDQDAMIVRRREHGFLMLNAFPYNNGHLLAAPYQHTAEISELPPEARLQLLELVDEAISLLRKMGDPDGFNVGINLGRVAGAGIVDHIHLHIVPRWNGDTNFMPVLADTKVLPEALEEVWGKLHALAEGLE